MLLQLDGFVVLQRIAFRWPNRSSQNIISSPPHHPPRFAQDHATKFLNYHINDIYELLRWVAVTTIYCVCVVIEYSPIGAYLKVNNDIFVCSFGVITMANSIQSLLSTVIMNVRRHPKEQRTCAIHIVGSQKRKSNPIIFGPFKYFVSSWLTVNGAR